MHKKNTSKDSDNRDNNNNNNNNNIIEKSILLCRLLQYLAMIVGMDLGINK